MWSPDAWGTPLRPLPDILFYVRRLAYRQDLEDLAGIDADSDDARSAIASELRKL
jgi:hypothetical protein